MIIKWTILNIFVYKVQVIIPSSITNQLNLCAIKVLENFGFTCKWSSHKHNNFLQDYMNSVHTTFIWCTLHRTFSSAKNSFDLLAFIILIAISCHQSHRIFFIHDYNSPHRMCRESYMCSYETKVNTPITSLTDLSFLIKISSSICNYF